MDVHIPAAVTLALKQKGVDVFRRGHEAGFRIFGCE
jgi:hypothetical protein